MPGGNPAVLERANTAGSNSATEERNLEDRVRSLRLSSIPQGSDWFRSLTLLVVGAGFLGILFYLVRETIQLNRSAGPAASAPVALAGGDNKQPGNAGTSSTAAVPTAVSRQGTTALESQGYIIPAHQILVSPQVSGRIVELHIEEGRRVEKGEVLAKLEDTEYQADMNRAKSMVKAASERLRELQNGSRPEEVAQAKAELGESQAQLAQLRTQWERVLTLRKTDAITEQEYEESESRYRAMEMRVLKLTNSFKLMELGPRDEQKENARALLDQAKADLVKAEWRLNNCIIRAPISGTILKKNAEEGNIVNPIAFNGSFSLCDMADLADLEVDLNVQERDVSTVFKGQKCRVRSLAYPDRTYEGYVSRLMPIADRAKGAVPVRVKLSIPAEEEGVYLKPEMGATVTFLKPELSPGKKASSAAVPPVSDAPRADQK